MVTSTSTIRSLSAIPSLHQYAVLHNCSLVCTMKNYNNNQRSAHTKNLLFLMTFSSTSSSWTPVASSKQSHYGTCEGPIVGVDRIFVAWQFGNTEENEGRKLLPCLWFTPWKSNAERNLNMENLEEIPNMAIIPWCSMFHFVSSHHPIFHLPLATLQRYPSSTCGVGIRQVGLQQSDHCQG